MHYIILITSLFLIKSLSASEATDSVAFYLSQNIPDTAKMSKIQKYSSSSIKNNTSDIVEKQLKTAIKKTNPIFQL